jgi:hypothetical protein
MKETKEGMVRQPLKYFINERQWEVILLSSFVEFPIVNTHPPSRYSALSDQVVLQVFNDCHASILSHSLVAPGKIPFPER